MKEVKTRIDRKRMSLEKQIFSFHLGVVAFASLEPRP